MNIQPYFSTNEKYLHYGTSEYTKQENTSLSYTVTAIVKMGILILK
jgi:hypothetical protein